jgi:hypothetical protein
MPPALGPSPLGGDVTPYETAFRSGPRQAHTTGMDHVSDEELVRLATELAATVGTTGGWHEPPQLYGLVPDAARRGSGLLPAGGRRWQRLAEGDPYRFLDAVHVRNDEVPALALIACGWAFPPDRPEEWHGRPSTHPRRVRVRTVVVVTPDGRQCSAIERRDTGGVIVDDRGEGPMMRALMGAWSSVSVVDPPPAA